MHFIKLVCFIGLATPTTVPWFVGAEAPDGNTLQKETKRSIRRSRINPSDNLTVSQPATRETKLQVTDADKEYDSNKIWERLFRQMMMSMPTEPPTKRETSTPTLTTVGPQQEECELSLVVECFLPNGNGAPIPCDQIPPPETDAECVKDVEYQYSVTNICDPDINPDCADAIIQTFDVMRYSQMKDLMDIVGSDDVIAPGETKFYIESNVKVEFCVDIDVETNAVVTANTPGPNVAICAAEAFSTFSTNFTPTERCGIEVDIECYVEVFGSKIECQDVPAPTGGESCEKEVTYEYIFQNPGPDGHLIVKVLRSREGETADIVDLVQNNRLAVGESTIATESTTLDFCADNVITTSIFVEAISTKPGNPGCIDNAMQSFTIASQPQDEACELEMTVECFLPNGNGAPIPCDQIPPPETDAECVKDVEYQYSVTNICDLDINPDCADAIIQTFDVMRYSQMKDLMDIVGSDDVIAPGETKFYIESNVKVEFCVDIDVETNAVVTANTPGPNVAICAAEAFSTFSTNFTPTEPCGVEIDVECYVEVFGSKIACQDIPTVEEDEDCLKDVTFEYTLNNPGPDGHLIVKLLRSREGDTTDIIDLVDKKALGVGDSTFALEMTTLDFCVERKVLTSVTVEAISTKPGNPGCIDTDMYEFNIMSICEVEVAIECYADPANDFSIPCESFNPFQQTPFIGCDHLINYVYTITNTGPTTQTVNGLSIQRESTFGEKQLIDKDFTLKPDETKEFNEFLFLNFCEYYPDGVVTDATVFAEMYPKGSTCYGTDSSVFYPPMPPCEVTLDSNVYCSLVSPFGKEVSCLDYFAFITDIDDPEQCIQDVVLEYQLTNIGLACLPITSVTSDIEGVGLTDITPSDDDSTIVCPDETIPLFQIDTIDLCSTAGLILPVVVEVNDGPPDTCGGFGSIDHSLPEGDCNLELNLTCQDDHGKECKYTNDRIECPDHPYYIDFDLTGDKCNSFHLGGCEEFGFFENDTTYVIVTSKDGKEVLYSNVVDVGGGFRVGSSHQKLSPEIVVVMYESKGGRVIQKLYLHVSCSKPFGTTDTFGALRVNTLGYHDHYISTPYNHFYFTYEITNHGMSDVNLQEVVFDINGPADVIVDVSDVILLPGESYTDTTHKVSIHPSPYHHEELVASATVFGQTLPFITSESCESTGLVVLDKEDECKERDIQCKDHPHELSFKFLEGNTCKDSHTKQPFECSDEHPFHHDDDSKYFIIFSDDDFETIYYKGYVTSGSEIVVNGGHHGWKSPDLVVKVLYNDDVKDFKNNLVQILKFHISCGKKPLYMGDVFGSMQVVGWTNKKQGMVTIDDIVDC